MTSMNDSNVDETSMATTMREITEIHSKIADYDDPVTECSSFISRDGESPSFRKRPSFI